MKNRFTEDEEAADGPMLIGTSFALALLAIGASEAVPAFWRTLALGVLTAGLAFLYWR